MKPSASNNYYHEHVSIITDSYQRLLGEKIPRSEIGAEGARESIAEAMFDAPFALLSHNAERKPVFNYANRTAMRLFNMTWEEITSLESRYSAEQPGREQRAQLLDNVKRDGFVDNYSGIRIAKGGARFYIEKATVWNLTDENGLYCGQAAMFSHWQFI